MAIPVARVHLAMAHAALPGLLPSPPKCTMLLPLLPAPQCAAIILPSSTPSRPSRADPAGRWDAHKVKIKQGGGSPASSPPPSSAGPGCTSLSEKWVSKKKSARAGAATSSSSPSSTSSSDGRADSEERWDAHKRPASPTSSSFSASSNKTKTRHISKRHSSGGRAFSPSSSAKRWDAHKKPRAPLPADDGERSTASNDMDQLLDKAFYAGPGFIRSPEPSMLPKPSFMNRMIRVA